MDFIPELGEPGIFDELFWFTPIILQIILAILYYKLLKYLKLKISLSIKILIVCILIIITDILLFVIIGKIMFL